MVVATDSAVLSVGFSTQREPAVRKSLTVATSWFRVISSREWSNFAQLRQVFSSADQVGLQIVFNIGGNKYRLIADVNYQAQVLLVRTVPTHQEYDRGGWKKS